MLLQSPITTYPVLSTFFVLSLLFQYLKGNYWRNLPDWVDLPAGPATTEAEASASGGAWQTVHGVEAPQGLAVQPPDIHTDNDLTKYYRSLGLNPHGASYAQDNPNVQTGAGVSYQTTAYETHYGETSHRNPSVQTGYDTPYLQADHGAWHEETDPKAFPGQASHGTSSEDRDAIQIIDVTDFNNIPNDPRLHQVPYCIRFPAIDPTLELRLSARSTPKFFMFIEKFSNDADCFKVDRIRTIMRNHAAVSGNIPVEDEEFEKRRNRVAWTIFYHQGGIEIYFLEHSKRLDPIDLHRPSTHLVRGDEFFRGEWPFPWLSVEMMGMGAFLYDSSPSNSVDRSDYMRNLEHFLKTLWRCFTVNEKIEYVPQPAGYWIKNGVPYPSKIEHLIETLVNLKPDAAMEHNLYEAAWRALSLWIFHSNPRLWKKIHLPSLVNGEMVYYENMFRNLLVDIMFEKRREK